MARTGGTNPTAGTRQDTFITRVFLNNAYMGVFDKRTGGALDSDDVTYYPGGMADRVSLGGRKTTDNVVLQRLYDLQDDHDKINTWFNAVGKGTVVIEQRPMDENENEYGKALIWIGKLKRVFVPEPDSEGTGAAMLEIEISVASSPTSS